MRWLWVGLALLGVVLAGCRGTRTPAVAEPAPVEIDWPDAAVMMVDAGAADAAHSPAD